MFGGDLECRQRLGEELRQARLAAGAKTRQVPPFSTGHISHVENGKTQPSRDLIEVYVRTFGGDRARLYALFEAALAESQRLKSAQRLKTRTGVFSACASPENFYNPSAVRRSCIVEGDDTTYTFDARGIVEEVRVSHLIRARAPNVRLFYANHSYTADRRPGVLKVEAGHGCHIELVEESSNGSLRVYFALDREINPDDSEPYPFSYRVLVSSSVRTDPILCHQPGPAAVLHYAVRAQFRPPMLPLQVWWFATETYAEGESNGRDGYFFELDPSGYYFKNFYKLVNGWNYGLGWQWP